jgi:CubicO group peptidase (beta-lactamase class C family)
MANDRLVQGFSSHRLAHLTTVMQAQVEAGMFPGAVTAILHRNQLVHFEAHGYLDAARSQPMTKDALFRLASMTKPLVTTVAMMMVEQGVFSLQDPITRWLPELKDLVVETPAGDVPLVRPIWVQDLMRHTSGFVYAGTAQSPRILGKIPLAHQPGTFWEYSISVDVLGLLLERVLGQSLDLIVAQALLEPLGMKDTQWWVTPEQEKKLAQTLDDDPLKLGMLKSYRQHYNPAGKSYFKGGAGLIGSTADYLRYLQMMINKGEFEGKRYLSRKSVDLMLSQHTVGMAGTTIANTGPGYGFGLGFAIRQGQGMCWVPGSINDAMWAGVWGTSFWLDPTEQLAAVIMAQGPTHKTHTRMLFKNLVYGALVE